MQFAEPKISEYDIAIVGGGVVGTTFACALKDSGFRVALIEAELTSQAVSRAQAYSLSLLSSQIFEGLDVWQHIRPEVETFKKVRLADSNFQPPFSLHPATLALKL